MTDGKRIAFGSESGPLENERGPQIPLTFTRSLEHGSEQRSEQNRRSFGQRAGIVCLNLLQPGLGLIRLGRLKAGLSWIAIECAICLVLLAVYRLGLIDDFPKFVMLMAGALLAGLTLLIGPNVQSWHHSRVLDDESLAWWRRWYVLLGIAAIGLGLWIAWDDEMHRYYKPFVERSASMTPSLFSGEHFFADMREGQPIERGSIVIVRHLGLPRVYRIVAMPGDRVKIASGVPVINGQKAGEVQEGQFRYADADGEVLGQLFTERLPGETSAYQVLDTGPGLVDDVAELEVPEGYVYVLGDNRDRAADSRVGAELGGVGLIPFADVVGRPLFVTWSSDRTRIGLRLAN